MYHERGTYNGKTKNNYLCSSYRKHTTDCTGHHIRVAVLEELVLDTLRFVSGHARENESEFTEAILKAAGAEQKSAVKAKRSLSP